MNLDSFDLFLFDFDGLLVDTEPMHFEAYIQALAKRGLPLRWDFETFCTHAHQSAIALKDALVRLFPLLEADWATFYGEKKREYLLVLSRIAPKLMEGAEELLFSLEKKKKKRCVVTNSPREQIMKICAHSPALQTIAHWFTREDYDNPKPHPDGYLRAIEVLGQPSDRIIGFEDSLRGIEALLGTRAVPVLVCAKQHPLMEEMLKKNVRHFTSLKECFQAD